MVLENYCRKCGHRILPTDPYCTGCGNKTVYNPSNINSVLTPPVHNIGFFNLDIDFSPFIITKRENFKYDICSCGYLNDLSNDFCYMCGTKRTQSRISKFFKKDISSKFSMDTVLCDCGTVNSNENIFCEICGKQLKEDVSNFNENYSNFNLEFSDSVFCFCGEENEKFSQFCRNCGLPLKNYGALHDLAILCTCSCVNEITSDFCIECGAPLKDDEKLICICGHKNLKHMKYCEECDRPLNPQRLVKTRLICSCGEILDWDTDFCYNCGKNIKQTIQRKIFINDSVRNLKSILRK